LAVILTSESGSLLTPMHKRLNFWRCIYGPVKKNWRLTLCSFVALKIFYSPEMVAIKKEEKKRKRNENLTKLTKNT